MFTWLLYDTLLAIPVALLAAFVRHRRGQARLEHGLWVIVLLLLVWPSWAFASAAAPAAGPAIVSSGPPAFGDRLVARITSTLGTNWSTRASQIGLGLFGIVAIGLIARELRRAWCVERDLRRARPVSRSCRRRIERAAGRVGVRVPRVVRTPGTEGPFLWTFGRTVLVLPDSGQAPDETVLLHELGHLARRDHWTAWLELVVQFVHFWNPLFWVARRHLRHAAELACDERVVALAPDRRLDYASALLEVVERSVPRASLVHAAHAAGEGARELEERLRRILEPRERVPQRARAAQALLLLGAIAVPTLAAPSLSTLRAVLPDLPAGIDEEAWTRALGRADEALRRDPDDAEALAARGVALLGLGRSQEALETFELQARLGVEVAKARYNQACAHARAGAPQRAIECLEAAEREGLDVASLVRVDPDLESLHAEPGAARWLRP